MSYKTVARDKLVARKAQLDITLAQLDAVPETEDVFVEICDTTYTWFRIQCGAPGDATLYNALDSAPTCFYVRNPPPEFLDEATQYLRGVNTDVEVVPLSYGSFGGGVYDVVPGAGEESWDLVRADVPLFVCMCSYYDEPTYY